MRNERGPWRLAIHLPNGRPLWAAVFPGPFFDRPQNAADCRLFQANCLADQRLRWAPPVDLSDEDGTAAEICGSLRS